MASQLIALRSFGLDGGHCYTCSLGAAEVGDSLAEPTRSAAELFEDGRPLGLPHVAHAEIREVGGGRFSHWHNHLYFSTSDNSDPRLNGRSYSLYVPQTDLSEQQRRVAGLIAKVEPSMKPLAKYAVAEALFYEVFPDAFLGEFGKSCWSDRAFVEAYLRIVPDNRRSFERKYVVSQLIESMRDVSGDMAECGVYNGGTAYFMAAAAAASGVRRRLHLFDSFEGLSAPQGPDGAFWTAGALSISEQSVVATLSDFTDWHIYRGWIPARFDEVRDRAFAFVHLDVDLYEPTLASLAFFYPRVVPGGMIVCDDSGFDNCPGATAAIAEFMRDKAERPVRLPTGQDLILKRAGTALGVDR